MWLWILLSFPGIGSKYLQRRFIPTHVGDEAMGSAVLFPLRARWFCARLGRKCLPWPWTSKDLSQHVAQPPSCAGKLSLGCVRFYRHMLCPFFTCSIQKCALAGALDTHPCFVCAVYSSVGRLNDTEILVTLCCWWSPECFRFINQAIVWFWHRKMFW